MTKRGLCTLAAGAAALFVFTAGASAGGCVGDFDGNNNVDGADLAILLGGWGGAGGDLDGNGTTDGADLAILLGAWGPCPINVCGGSANDCCAPGTGPGCSDAACCETVCAVDPFCCATEWDGFCVNGAVSLCAPLCDSCGVSANDCCVASPTGAPFCNDATCCEAICAADPFCCAVSWDQICADAAATQCTVCLGVCGGSPNDCCVANNTPGCSDAACCDAICAADPFCCDTAWDNICADAALTQCAGCQPGICDTSTNDCCVENTTPGCSDTACCEAICAADPFCCETEWDQICAEAAVAQCAGCQLGICDTSTNDCCVANPTPGCSDTACCESICAVDPFCCNNQWDGLCANAALTQCASCQGVCNTSTNDCCVANTTPGCSDTACCESICAVDPFCCSNQWDNLCANAALAQCAVCTVQPSNCCTNWGGLGCDDPTCQATICAADPFCCATSWDTICANAAIAQCGVCQ